MTRDMDYVRATLLRIEEANSPRMMDLLSEDSSGADLEKLQYHLVLLTEAGLVRGITAHTLAGKNWLDLNLTWSGHEFADSVRDPAIWRQAKEGASKAGGFSLDLLGALAKGLVKKQIERHTGVELEL